MKSLLVISNEPALSEILANELPECNVTAKNIQEAGKDLEEKKSDLVIMDAETVYRTALPDHYIITTRPVRLKNLIQEIYEKLRAKPAKQEVLLPGGSILSLSSRGIYSSGGILLVALTEKECELLQCIALRAEAILSRQLLLKKIWGYGEAIDTHTLETHIYRLRTKLKQISDTWDIGFSEDRGYFLG